MAGPVISASLMRFSIPHDRTVTRPAAGIAQRPAIAVHYRSHAFSLYAATGIVADRDSPMGGGVPRAARLFTRKSLCGAAYSPTGYMSLLGASKLKGVRP